MRHAEMFEIKPVSDAALGGPSMPNPHLVVHGWRTECVCGHVTPLRPTYEESYGDRARHFANNHALATAGGPSMPNPHLVVHGWRTECVCGYITPLRPTYEKSYGDRARHFANHHARRVALAEAGETHG